MVRERERRERGIERRGMRDGEGERDHQGNIITVEHQRSP